MSRLRVLGRPGASQPATTGQAGPNGGDSPVPARPAPVGQGQARGASSRGGKEAGLPPRHAARASDPLDRGVPPPERWTAGIRYGTTESEQERGESLDQWLTQEEPDVD